MSRRPNPMPTTPPPGFGILENEGRGSIRRAIARRLRAMAERIDPTPTQ